MRLFTGYLRKEDLKSAEAVDAFVANSAFVAERIRRIYGRESTVVHPPVDVDFFGASIQCPHPAGLEPKSYYLYAGELRDYKRPDLAVEACLRMGRKLVVVGNGKMREALTRRIGGNGDVVFLGRVSDDGLREVFAGARALLFPGVEDFGIVPVEAQAAGTPVVALGAGGALETVRDGETGMFFNDPDVESICGAIEKFEGADWDSDACRRNAARFAPSVFKSKMQSILS
jgi:glycosyltransferase involved in cell wall biosynthesis